MHSVFIVDDSPIVRDRLVQLLEEVPDLKVVGHADLAFDAIRSIRRTRPNAVVIDISMPGGSGIHVLESLQELNPRPLSIMLTNFSHAPYRQRCSQLGANFFFDKSREFERVQQVLSALTASSSRDSSPRP